MRHRKVAVTQESYAVPSAVSSGVTDLMTSLAVIFILLFAAYVNRAHESPDTHAQSPEEQQTFETPVLTQEEHRPEILMVSMPEAALNFEFGESRLLPSAEAFLSEAMPQYAGLVCAEGGKKVEAFVIEGYTDDLGDDLRNLRLSQERSFAVLAKSMEVVREKLPWAYECFLQKATANGRGRQNLLRDDAGYLDRGRSRRVVFKIHLRPQ